MNAPTTAPGTAPKTAFKELVFSGIQPSGFLHLGNYLGAIVRFVELQNRYNCIYCVVDLHAITVWQDPQELNRAIREVTAAFIASGIDPKKHIVFNQSQVAEHAELAWVFNCVARLGWLNRMTQFKEKAGKDRENASVGLYAYPNLMAADILVYRATHVPVGEDQKQHLELARDIAQKFNNDYARIDRRAWLRRRVLPAARAADPGTGDAGHVAARRLKKMSKSDPSDQSRINLTDDAEAIALKIRRAKTDPEPLPPGEGAGRTAGGRQSRRHLRRARERDQGRGAPEFGGAQFSAFKPALTDLLVAKLSPITAEMRRLMADPAISIRCSPTAPRGRRRWPRRDGRGEGHRRLRAPAAVKTSCTRNNRRTDVPCVVAGAPCHRPGAGAHIARADAQ